MNKAKTTKSKLKDLLDSWDAEANQKATSAIESTTVTINLRTDALILSVAAHRMNSEKFGKDYVTAVPRVADQYFWNNDVVWQSHTYSDSTQAQIIRDYYSQRETWRRLSGDYSKLEMYGTTIDFRTEYQQRFDHFIAGEGTTVLQEISGMIQRIPYFYELDLAYDQLTAHPDMQPDTKPECLLVNSQQRELMAITKFDIKTRHFTGTEFWFSNREHGLSSIRVSHDNSLAGVMHWLYQRPQPMVIHGDWKIRTRGRDRKLVFSEPSNWHPV